MASRPTPDISVTGGSRDTLISNAKVMLYQSWSFLADYLPLANSLASDFIVKNLWSFFVPQNIQEELLKMSDDELSSLPSGMHGKVISEGSVKDDKGELYNAEQEKANIRAEENKEPFDPVEHRLEFIKCHFLEKSSVSVKGKKTVHLQTCPISWKHSNLYEFTQAAQKHILTSMDVLTAVSDVVNVQRRAVQDDDADAAGDYRLNCVLMSQKKSHEVEVMAEVCAHMADVFKTNLTVDLGSGKGYLSTQLCYEFNHLVIGIDSSCTNTEGATKRAGRLEKEWNVSKKQPVKQMKSSHKHKKQPSDSLPKNCTANDFKADSRSSESKCSSCDVDKLSDSFTAFDVHDEDVDMLHAEAADIKSSDQIVHSDCSSTSQTGDLEKTTRINKSITISCDFSTANDKVKGSWDHSDSLCDQDSDEKHKRSSSSLKHTTAERMQNTSGDRSESVKEDRFIPLTKYVDSNMKMMESVKESVVDLGLDPHKARLLLTGLHTCGGLGSSLVRLFVNSPSVRAMCNVACCYHLLEEEFVASPFSDDASAPSDFPMSSYLQEAHIGLGKASRNIACLSVHRMNAEKQLQGQSFYSRALLEKIIYDVVGDVGHRGQKLRKLDKRSKSLHDYMVKAFTRLGLPTEKVTRDLVEDYDKRYSHVRRQLAAFVQLRAVLAPCIESLILLDRYLYLLEQDNVQDVYLTQLFNPVLSPRCFAIIATKRS